MLERIGLTTRQERVYRTLIGEPQLELSGLMSRVGLTREDAQAEINALINAGLVLAGSLDGPFTVADPEGAIAMLIKREHQALDQVRIESARLSEKLRTIRQWQDTSSIIEVVTGAEAIDNRWAQGQRRARGMIRMTDRPPYYGGANVEKMNLQLELMKQGLSYRTLYDQSIFDTPHHVDRTFLAIRAGEDARVLPDVPIKLVLIDDDEALLVLLTSGEEHEPAVIVVHPSALLDSLIALYELLWSRGRPITSDIPKPDEEDIPRQLLALLAAGLKDEAIALELDVTVRTVRRRIAALYEQLGVHNRFQAGVAAKERGWL